MMFIQRIMTAYMQEGEACFYRGACPEHLYTSLFSSNLFKRLLMLWRGMFDNLAVLHHCKLIQGKQARNELWLGRIEYV